MTPRTDVVSIDADAPLPDARRLIAQSGFSRIPATRGSLDAIVGILYAKDLLGRSGHEDEDGVRVRDVMRPPVFVPETKRLGELMHEFRRRQVHAAVVLDEYGGTSGLVTMEDVVEEIVGEIADEYDPAAPPGIRPVADGGWDVDARVHVDELNDEIGVEIPEHEDYETIGGFVLSRLGAIPKPGETLEAEGLRIRVLDADPRRILRLRLERTAAAREPTTED
jgi:CBS domain containing-hemolysin-like protein